MVAAAAGLEDIMVAAGADITVAIVQVAAVGTAAGGRMVNGMEVVGPMDGGLLVNGGDTIRSQIVV